MEKVQDDWMDRKKQREERKSRYQSGGLMSAGLSSDESRPDQREYNNRRGQRKSGRGGRKLEDVTTFL